MRKLESAELKVEVVEGLETRTIGDSRGYLWKITINSQLDIGRIEKVSGLSEAPGTAASVDGNEYVLPRNNSVRDNMQFLTSIIESRFHAA